MQTIDFYILRKVLKPLLLALLVAILVLLLERILRLLDVILGSEGPLGIFFEIIAYLLPEYAGLALPMSLLLGVMLGFNQLGRDGETDAFQASGLGLARQTRAAVLLALVMMVITATILGYVKPFARYAYQSVVYAVTQAAFHVLLRPNVFAEFGTMTVLVGGLRTETGTFSDVFVYETRADGGSIVITARDGALSRAEDGGSPVLRLFDGIRLAVGPVDTSAPPVTAETVGVLRFRELRTVMTNESAGLFRPRGGDRREYTLDELWRLRQAPPEGLRRTDIVSELNVRIVQSLSVMVLPFLAVSLALGRRRSDRIYGIAAGLLLLIGYNQCLDFGKNLVQGGKVGPELALWLPLLVFAAGSFYAFFRAAERVPRAFEVPGSHWLAVIGRGALRRFRPPSEQPQ
jgi:lipopolysaccharide export system permease protein